MKNKLIFRILGALASALIIVSVFIPFVSVTGYSTSLWESFASTIYLPIMIIVFGGIGVIFFSLNIKTEFAYMSTGAIIFFIVMQTIDILDQGAFNTLSVGYYSLILGTVLTGIMAFLTNLKSKNKTPETVSVSSNNQPTVLDQIDRLYNNQELPQTEISPIQPITAVIEPIPVQSINSIESISIEPVVNLQVSNDTTEQTVEQVANEVPVQSVTPIPVVESQAIVQPVNPVTQEFSIPQANSQSDVELQPTVQPVNPVAQQFSNPTSINPVTQEFSMPQSNLQSVVQEHHVVQPEVKPQPNPVVNEFTNPTPTVESQQSSGLDIFGQ